MTDAPIQFTMIGEVRTRASDELIGEIRINIPVGTSEADVVRSMVYREQEALEELVKVIWLRHPEAGTCPKCNRLIYHRPGKPGEYDSECVCGQDAPAPPKTVDYGGKGGPPPPDAREPVSKEEIARREAECAAKLEAYRDSPTPPEREGGEG